MFLYTEDEFDVTQEDIDEGVEDDSEECAIARAARRRYDYPYVVTTSFFFARDRRDGKVYQSDPAIEKYIKSFDKDKDSVGPITVVTYKDTYGLRFGIKGEDV